MSVGTRRFAAGMRHRVEEARGRIRARDDLYPKLKVVSLEVTRACNLRCDFCWLYGANGTYLKMLHEGKSLVKDQLTLGEIGSLVADLPPETTVYLAGGEPFARPDILDVIEVIAHSGHRIGMTTNGTLIDEATAYRLAANPKVASIAFSIDGPEDVHDEFRGRGNYAKSMRAVADIVRFRGSDGPHLIANSVMTGRLFGRTQELVRATREAGFDEHRIQQLWWTSPAALDAQAKALRQDFGVVDGTGPAGHVMEPPGPAYGNRAATEVIEAQRAVYPYLVRGALMLSPAQGERYYSGVDFRVSDHCFKPWDEMGIRADGGAVVCPDGWIEYRLGNVRRENVMDIWTNMCAQHLREKIRNGGLYPGCARCCHINMAARG